MKEENELILRSLTLLSSLKQPRPCVNKEVETAAFRLTNTTICTPACTQSSETSSAANAYSLKRRKKQRILRS